MSRTASPSMALATEARPRTATRSPMTTSSSLTATAAASSSRFRVVVWPSSTWASRVRLAPAAVVNVTR